MSRLASLQGPSSPSPNPVRAPRSPAKSPKASRSKEVSIYDRLEANTTPPTETTYHRKLRTLLLELKAVANSWNDVLLGEGLKAAKGLTDARTELTNALSALSSDYQPRIRAVTPKLVVMDTRYDELQTAISKLQKLFMKMTWTVSNAEDLLYEACRTKGHKWVEDEPLWCTWTLERFVSRMPPLLAPYHRSLELCTAACQELRSHAVTFERSREILREWVAQTHLTDEHWGEFLEICEVEVERWLETRCSTLDHGIRRAPFDSQSIHS